MQRQKEIEEAKIREGETSFLQSEDYHKKLSEIESLLAEEFGLSSDDDTISEGGMESSNEESSKTEDVSIIKILFLLRDNSYNIRVFQFIISKFR